MQSLTSHTIQLKCTSSHCQSTWKSPIIRKSLTFVPLVGSSAPSGPAAAASHHHRDSSSTGRRSTRSLRALPRNHHRQPGTTSADHSRLPCQCYDAYTSTCHLLCWIVLVLAGPLLFLAPLRNGRNEGRIPHQPNGRQCCGGIQTLSLESSKPRSWTWQSNSSVLGL